jgi:hypothetical protein
MSWLKRVIARLLGLPTQSTVNPAQPTQTVGLAHQEPTQVRGNKRSAQATKPLKSAPAPKKRSSKPKAALPTTQASSRKAEPKSAQAESGQNGKQRKTLVSKTPQRVKSAPKRKP